MLPEGASLLLLGLRGSGKTTLGRELASCTGRAFIDLDDLTRDYLGLGTIAELFAKVGEARFRAAEYRALVNQAFPMSRLGPVVALGGGTPTAPGASDFLQDAKQRGIARLVYLRASADALRTRLEEADNADRPSLTGKGVLDEIDDILAARDPLYQELADRIIEVDHLSVEEALELLLEDARPGPPPEPIEGAPGPDKES